MLVLLGCGASPELGDKPRKTSIDKQAKGINDGVSVNKPLIIPPGYDAKSLGPGENANQTLPNGLPALETIPKGLKLEALFTEKTDDEEERFERLENALVEFRKEYDQIKPSVVRLAAIETDMQDLMGELEHFVQNESPQENAEPLIPIEPVLEAPQPLTQNDITSNREVLEPKQSPTPQASLPATTLIKSIRIGNHPDKVRIVLDIDGTPEYEFDLDNQEQVLIVSLTGAITDTTLEQEKHFPGNPLLSSYSINRDHSTARLIINLKKDTQILTQEFLLPQGERKLHRLFFDLKK